LGVVDCWALFQRLSQQANSNELVKEQYTRNRTTGPFERSEYFDKILPQVFVSLYDDDVYLGGGWLGERSNTQFCER
jgi:hypothetical protein